MLFFSSQKRLDYPRKGWLKKQNTQFMTWTKNLESCTTITWYVLFKLLDHKAFNPGPIAQLRKKPMSWPSVHLLHVGVVVVGLKKHKFFI